MKKSKTRIIYDYTNMLASAVGNEHGVTEREIRNFEKRAGKIVKDVRSKYESGGLEFMELPSRRRDARVILKFAGSVKKEYENFVVLGIGGSALGAMALHGALNPPYYNLLPPSARKGCPRIFFEDNVDPVRVASLLEVINPKKTLFNVVTKSGGTAETLAAFLIVDDVLRRSVGAKKLAHHIAATTDEKKGNLREMVQRLGLPSFTVPAGVGGRFSVLSAVGLLPAAMAGIDILELLRGAAAARIRCLEGDLEKNPALLSAVLQYIACTKKGKAIQVMMPYSNQLFLVADWYRQLWAESLGKKYTLKGNIVHAGQTPIKSLGATDQHSQIQLYVEGPNDKTVTFLRIENLRTDVKIPHGYSDLGGFAYLGGHSLGELLNAEQRGTEIALTAACRPNSTFILPEINPYLLGQLLFILQMQATFAGALFGINPFDQPGVEGGKVAAFALMGRPGYEKHLDNLKATERKLPRRQV
ncbi:MAG: glucose-6-phosphate isomerase [bacterium]